eukprot:Amastigsp_a852697_29.p2 type:complete len:102 gc:universal Amastigsp_a852697_29:221-526(+)
MFVASLVCCKRPPLPSIQEARRSLGHLSPPLCPRTSRADGSGWPVQASSQISCFVHQSRRSPRQHRRDYRHPKGLHPTFVRASYVTVAEHEAAVQAASTAV